MSLTETILELSISCKNLSNADALSKSDPVVILYEFNRVNKKWCEVFRTETIKNNLNPNFAKKYYIPYHFEEQQKLKFEVYDIDYPEEGTGKQDFLGSCSTTVGEVLSAVKLERCLESGPSKNNGSIIIIAEEARPCNDELVIGICGKKLDKKDTFGRSDPFLAFSRINEDGSFNIVHRTEVIKQNLNPSWDRIVLPVRLLCNGDLDRAILIQCFDWNQSGRDKLIGDAQITVNELLQKQSLLPIYIPLINSKDAGKKKNYVNSGHLQINTLKLEKAYNFIDYIQGGTDLNCCFAIDFTGSNGDPEVPGTLHFCSANTPSNYAIALQAVGEIISDYDSDRLFPAFGFGAIVPPSPFVSHSFSLNGNPQNPFCLGVEGVLAAYYQCIQTVKFSGPTNFAPIITQISNLARGADDGSKYFILLILTDGVICDMPQTKAAIVDASLLPISIIIIGIGAADFKEMEELDSDDVKLSSHGKNAERDIVQFVALNNILNNVPANDVRRQLTQRVLAELPNQLVSYMRMRDVTPRSLNRVGPNKSGTAFPSEPPPYPTN